MAYYIVYFDRYDTVTDVCKYSESEYSEFERAVDLALDSGYNIQYGYF